MFIQALTERRMDALGRLTDGGVTNVWVHRETVMLDLFNLYETTREITECLATFSFYGEQGMDLDGVKREAYSIFWRQVLDEYFEGSCTFVPRVGPGIEESTMRTLGKIISHQYVLTGIFPVQINKGFMVATLCGRQALDNEDLIGAFLEYVSDNESQALKAALTQSEQGQLSDESCDFLLEFLSDYQVTKRPSATNLKAVLVQVAKNELLSKPAMAMDSMREGLRDSDYKDLWMCSKEDVLKVYEMMHLTPQRVLSMLCEEPSTHLHKSRVQMFSYLKKYIRCLSRKELGVFVRYVTGSSLPVVESIKVIFHVNELGSFPHPIAHTCAASIDLPDSGYASFNDFRVQMDSLLRNELSWKFTSL